MGVARDAAEQKLVDDVDRYGWHVMTVSSAVGEPDEPAFAYTIGLQESFGWPELLCCGLETGTMPLLLNNAVDELRATEAVPAEGLILRDVAAGVECKLSPVAQRHLGSHLGSAIWFARYRGEDARNVSCLQLLWPDRDGRFPDEPDCPEAFRAEQPVLSV